jgi:tagatose-1,6-bisphosphate aldolase non-catalytic subunit AgaZ/GatZ
MTNTPNTKSVPSVAQASKPDETKLTTVTLDQLAGEMKMTPRDARMLLRLAAKQIKQYPNLGKEHVARQPWQWTPGSRALEEARKALSATPSE